MIEFSIKKLFSLFLIGALFLLNIPTVFAQDVVTSEDFSGGASVFTFRQSRKATQKKAAVKRGFVSKRSQNQRKTARRNLKTQMTTVAKTKPARQRVKPVDPQTVANLQARTTAAKIKASQSHAGAGETYLDRNEYDNAIESFKKAVALNPKNAAAKQGLSEAYTMKGDSLMEAENPVQAALFYDEAIKNNSQNAAAFAGAGAASEALGKTPAAIVAYEKALALNPDLTAVNSSLGALYYQQGEIARAENHLKKATASNPANAESQLYLGLVNMKQNQPEAAMASLNRAAQLDPNSAEAHYYLGSAYSSQNKPEEAVAEYHKALAINPNYTDALFDLGVAQYNQQKYAESAETYQKVVTVDPTHGEAHANLAESYRQLEQYDKANAEYGVAADYVKDDPDLYTSWGYCLGKENKWDKASVRLQTAVEMKGDAVDYSNLSWAHNRAAQEDFKAKREPEANARLTEGKKAAERATEINPNLAAAYVNLGTSSNGLGDYQTSKNALEKAAELQSDWYFVHNELGIALRGLGMVAEAIVRFQKVTSLNQNFAMGFYNLGRAQYAKGDKKDAEKTMKHLKKLDATLANELEGIIKGKIKDELMRRTPLNKIPTNKIPLKLPFP